VTTQYIQCVCGNRYRCGECRKDICYCTCRFEEPTDAQLAGHGINTEVPDKELAR
jgi:hypothetical protein